jgi:hypothetical protein
MNGSKAGKMALVGLMAATVAGGAQAAAFTVGYLPIEHRTNYDVVSASGGNGSTGEQKDNLGVLTFGGQSMASVLPWLSVGLSAGGSMTAHMTFDLTKTEQPTAGNPNSQTGDTVTRDIMVMPILGRIEASFKAGPGRLCLGLGAGAVIFGIRQQMIDQHWWDGSTSGSASASKSTSSNVAGGKVTTDSTTFVSAFTMLLAPAYHLELTDTLSLGVEIPILLMNLSGHVDGTSVEGGQVALGTGSSPTSDLNASVGINLVISSKL